VFIIKRVYIDDDIHEIVKQIANDNKCSIKVVVSDLIFEEFEKIEYEKSNALEELSDFDSLLDDKRVFMYKGGVKYRKKR
jgi:hypothetical protein